MGTGLHFTNLAILNVYQCTEKQINCVHKIEQDQLYKQIKIVYEKYAKYKIFRSSAVIGFGTKIYEYSIKYWSIFEDYFISNLIVSVRRHLNRNNSIPFTFYLGLTLISIILTARCSNMGQSQKTYSH